MKIIKKLFHFSRRMVAKYWLARMFVTQIAVTGSQGKTAVSQGLFAMLTTLRPTVVTDVNLDTIYNVPITALKVRPYHHYAIFELGIDKLSEMDFHLGIVKPDIAVITGVSPVHSDDAHMKSFENVKKEKKKIIEALTDKGVAILNYSDVDVRAMAAHTKARVVWYGRKEDFDACHPEPVEWVTDLKTKAEHDDFVSFSNIKATTEGTEFDLYDTGSQNEIRIKTKLIGTFHAANICAIYCILKTLNPYFIQNFANGVQKLLVPLVGRMNIEDGPKGTVILNDSLRANPTSAAGGLETFANIDYANGRKVVIMADMGELEKPEEEHRKIGKLIAHLPIDMVVCAGKMQKFVAIEAARNKSIEVHYFDTVADAKKEIMEILKPHDFIYLKGSLYSKVGEIFEKT